MSQPTRFPVSSICALLAAGLIAITSWAQEDPRELYAQARMLDENNQNLTEAIKLYGQAAELAKDQPALATNALLQMGQCHERLGQAEAVKAYQRVVDDYPQQTEEVKVAQERLAALSALVAQNSKLPTFTRLRIPTRFSGLAKLSADGKRLAFVSEHDLWVVSLDGKVAPDLAGGSHTITRPWRADYRLRLSPAKGVNREGYPSISKGEEEVFVTPLAYLSTVVCSALSLLRRSKSVSCC